MGGGFGHFYAYAPIKIEYAIDRFAMETKRLLDVLDRRLGESRYLAGDAYTIADIATFPWYGGLVEGSLYSAAEFLSVQDYRNVKRWADDLLSRPAVKRGRMVNRTWGDPAGQLRERHDASDFDTKTGDKLAADYEARAYANAGGGTKPPNSRSISRASSSVVRSSSQGPTIWTPIGSPSDVRPAGTAVAGNPGRVATPGQMSWST